MRSTLRPLILPVVAVMTVVGQGESVWSGVAWRG